MRVLVPMQNTYHDLVSKLWVLAVQKISKKKEKDDQSEHTLYPCWLAILSACGYAVD
jgi:hypothetical protein